MSKKEVRNNLIFLVVFIGIIVLGRGGHIQRAYLMTGLGNASSAPNIENSAPPTQDVVLMDMSGDRVLLSQLHGKTVFVNLWATWCGPCVAEMPSISSLYEKVDKDKVAFVMITRDDPKSADKVVKFLERGDTVFPVYWPQSAMPPSLSSSSIPATFVISPEGKVIYQHVGIANYDTEEFLKMLENGGAS